MHVLHYQVVGWIGHDERAVQAFTKHLQFVVYVVARCYLCLQKFIKEAQQVVPKQRFYRSLSYLNILIGQLQTLLLLATTQFVYRINRTERVFEQIRD